MYLYIFTSELGNIKTNLLKNNLYVKTFQLHVGLHGFSLHDVKMYLGNVISKIFLKF